MNSPDFSYHDIESLRKYLEETPLVAIDVGTTKISVVVAHVHIQEDAPLPLSLSPEYVRIQLMALATHPSYGMEAGYVKNKRYLAQALRRAIEDANAQCHFKIQRALVSVAGIHLETRDVESRLAFKENMHEICQEDLRELVQQAISNNNLKPEDIIHIVPLEYHVYRAGTPIIISQPKDTEIIGTVGSAITARFRLIYADRYNIKLISDTLAEIGITTTIPMLQPLASAAAVLTDTEKEFGAVMVDIGGGTTDVAIFRKHRLEALVCNQLGGDDVDHDIAQMLGIPKHVAQKIKETGGSCSIAYPNPNLKKWLKDKQISHATLEIPVSLFGGGEDNTDTITITTLVDIIRARYEDIFNYCILRPIAENQIPVGPATRFIFTGGGSLLPGFEAYAREHLHHEKVFIRGPERWIDPSNSQVVLPKGREAIFSTVIGMLLLYVEELIHGKDPFTASAGETAKSTSWLSKLKQPLSNWFRFTSSKPTSDFNDEFDENF